MLRESATSLSGLTDSSPEPAPSPAHRVWAIVGLLPEVSAAALIGFSTVAMIFLDLKQFRAILVLPIGVLAAVAGAWFVLRLGLVVDHDRPASRRIADGLALLGVLLFVVINAHYAAQDLKAFRDPTTYAVTGQWLTHHSNALVDTQQGVFGNAARQLVFNSPGFGVDNAQLLYAQGNHLLPALLAVGGWVGGPAWALRGNVVLAGLGLLAVYGFARRLTHPLAALLATAGLGVSLPFVFAARDAYTEISEMALLFGGLALLWLGVRSRSAVAYAMAGLCFGGVSMAHVDGTIIQFAVVAYVVVALIAVPVSARRRTLALVGAFVLGDGITTLLGWLDLTRLSPGYYRDRTELRTIGHALIAEVVLGAVVVAIAWGLPAARTRWRRWSPWIAISAAVLFVIVMAVLASRPLWLVTHSSTGNSYIAFLQHGYHQPVDATRTYTELTVDWVGWYTGWFAVVLGVVGLAALIWRSIRFPDLAVLALPLSVLAPLLLYLNAPHITPDQLWATRRLVWGVYPGIFICAAVVIGFIGSGARWRRPIAAVLALVLAGYPLLATKELFRVRIGSPQLAMVQSLCHEVGPHSALVLVDSTFASGYMGTFRAYCNVPTAMLAKADRTTLAALQHATTAHDRALYVVSSGEGPLTPVAASQLPIFTDVHWAFWSAVLTKPASHHGVTEDAIVVARVTPDGSAVAVAGRGPFNG